MPALTATFYGQTSSQNDPFLGQKWGHFWPLFWALYLGVVEKGCIFKGGYLMVEEGWWKKGWKRVVKKGSQNGVKNGVKNDPKNGSFCALSNVMFHDFIYSEINSKKSGQKWQKRDFSWFHFSFQFLSRNVWKVGQKGDAKLGGILSRSPV